MTYFAGGGVAVAAGAAMLWLLNRVNEHNRAEALRRRREQANEVQWP